VRPAMMPPFDSVVRWPLRGVEINAQTPSATFSRDPNGSRAMTSPSGDCAQARREPAASSCRKREMRRTGTRTARETLGAKRR
jgi:hypothetical protein